MRTPTLQSASDSQPVTWLLARPTVARASELLVCECVSTRASVSLINAPISSPLRTPYSVPRCRLHGQHDEGRTRYRMYLGAARGKHRRLRTTHTICPVCVHSS
jgi:hypothetical protein